MLGRLSLTARLTALYTLVSAVVLVGLGILVVFATSRHFVELDRDYLLDKIGLIQKSSGNLHRRTFCPPNWMSYWGLITAYSSICAKEADWCMGPMSWFFRHLCRWQIPRALPLTGLKVTEHCGA
jgi:hypothetical protein